MSELPDGWALASVEDLLAPLSDGRLVHQGWSPQCERESAPDNQWGVLKTTAIQAGQFMAHENKRLPEELKPRPLLEVQAGDLLLTCAGPRARCGVACLVRETRPNLMISGKMYRFRVNPAIAEPQFIEFSLLSPDRVDAIDEMKTGISDSGLNLTHERFRALTLPIAPLPEQRRIVAAIEEAFSKLDAGEAGLRTVRQLLKRMRDAILTAAVTGRLVPQDPTDTPAPKLLADLGARSTAMVEAPTGWVLAELGDLLVDIEAGKSFATEGRPAAPGEVGVIKVSAMTWGHFLPSENKALPQGSVIDERWVIRRGDLLLSRANTAEYVGACVLVLQDHEDLILSDKSLRLKPSAGVDSRWLLHALRSRPTRDQIELLATGTKESMRNISQAKLRSLRVLVPPSAEQSRIAEEVERQLSFIDACERAVDAGLARSAALRRSVLKAAFEGRLVPQDPSDEAASVLLERIRAERAAAPGQQGKRKKKAEAS